MDKRMKNKPVVYAGDEFGRLTVIGIVLSNKGNKLIRKAECICECGNVKSIDIPSLIKGATKSCGCLHKEIKAKRRITHNMSFDPIYNVFRGMKIRCYDKNWKFYYRYGGRGITICDEWMKDQTLFFKWAYENGYKKGLSIDRTNNNKGYSPDNCAFVTQERQMNNTRSNRIINHNGESMSLPDFCRKYNYNYRKLYWRITYKKLSIDEAIINCIGFKGTNPNIH